MLSLEAISLLICQIDVLMIPFIILEILVKVLQYEIVIGAELTVFFNDKLDYFILTC